MTHSAVSDSAEALLRAWFEKHLSGWFNLDDPADCREKEEAIRELNALVGRVSETAPAEGDEQWAREIVAELESPHPAWAAEGAWSKGGFMLRVLTNARNAERERCIDELITAWNEDPDRGLGDAVAILRRGDGSPEVRGMNGGVAQCDSATRKDGAEEPGGVSSQFDASRREEQRDLSPLGPGSSPGSTVDSTNTHVRWNEVQSGPAFDREDYDRLLNEQDRRANEERGADPKDIERARLWVDQWVFSEAGPYPGLANVVVSLIEAVRAETLTAAKQNFEELARKRKEYIQKLRRALLAIVLGEGISDHYRYDFTEAIQQKARDALSLHLEGSDETKDDFVSIITRLEQAEERVIELERELAKHTSKHACAE